MGRGRRRRAGRSGETMTSKGEGGMGDRRRISMMRRTAAPRQALAEVNDEAIGLDERLDALLSLIHATASADTNRVLARHLLGAFAELAEAGRFPGSSPDDDPAASSRDFFASLDELIALGYVTRTVDGYGLTTFGTERAAELADAAMDDVAASWRI